MMETLYWPIFGSIFFSFVDNSSTFPIRQSATASLGRRQLTVRWDGLLAVQIHLFQLARFTDVTASGSDGEGEGESLLCRFTRHFPPLQMNFGLP